MIGAAAWMMGGDKQEHIRRARELRAQHLTIDKIKAQLEEEGVHYSTWWIRKAVKGVPCPQLRGNPRRNTPEQTRATNRAWRYRHRHRLNKKQREERANETPHERMIRLQQYAIYREQARERRARSSLLTLLTLKVMRDKPMG